MKDRLCLVTGASSGIGLATAEGLAARGATVWIVGRHPERTAQALTRIRAAGAREARAFRADFSSLAEVRRLAREVLAADRPIHALVNNAGLWHLERRESADGLEDTFAVNHLAPFLLTQLLLTRLLESGDDVRIVHVSSRLHAQAGTAGTWRGRIVHAASVLKIPHRSLAQPGFDFDDLAMQRSRYSGLGAYARSKLAQILFSNELARRLAGTSVATNAVHPGDVATEVVRDSPFLVWGQRLVKGLLKTPEEGAKTTLRVTTDPALGGVSGRYFADAKEKTPSPAALDEAAALRLWHVSIEMSGLELGELAAPVR